MYATRFDGGFSNSPKLENRPSHENPKVQKKKHLHIEKIYQ